MNNLTTKILWAVFIGLLAVLLPHTAWLFGQFEAQSQDGLFDLGTVAAWAGAFAFESAIAVLTHKLAKHIENAPKRFHQGPKWFSDWPKFKYRYVNSYSLGLVIAVMVSVLANLAHSVEFGRELAIFAQWGIPAKVYQVAFGGALPVVSLLFARVLSNVSETEDENNPELDKANQAIDELRKENRITARQVKEAEERARIAEDQARNAEAKFSAAGELFARIFADEKKQRILAARKQWPELPASAIAIITDTSASYVSEVINDHSAL